MNTNSKKVVFSLGWDVGGWLGNKNAFCLIRAIDGKIDWISEPKRVHSKDLDELNSVIGLVRFLLKNENNAAEILESFQHPSTRKVIGVDAPLGYPLAFHELVSRSSLSSAKTEYEALPTSNFGNRPAVMNIYGFRETERHLKNVFKKRTLSAPFDFLGNNASLANHVRFLWEQEGFVTLPFGNDIPNPGNVIIEVYPGIFKLDIAFQAGMQQKMVVFREVFHKTGNIKIKGFDYYLKQGTSGKDKTDEIDAVICAFLGLGFWLDDPDFRLAKEIPQDLLSSAMKEGWIYYPEI